MDLVAKLEILADAAKYDVACTSSGIDRDAQKGKLGNTLAAGCCHSFAADGRCITLLKVLMTNVCVYDCAYCVNRASNEVPRAAFKPRELADLTIAFYRRNYIEGLFLSSGVIRNPDYTTELMIQTLSILREEHGFRGYIHAKAVPGTDAVQLNREHRLYQADWLLRFYRFDVTEIIDEDNPFLDPDLDPKANWAINHLDFFPVEVNTAPLEALLRVPGIGVRGANLIVRARRTTCLREPELRKLGIAYKRARFFITCSGSYSGRGVDFSREGLRAQLAAPIKGGNHGRRADKTTPGQMSLFESVETPEKARIAGGSGARALESGDATAAASCSDAERSSNAASSSGRAASADGTYGWQRALETPEAVCA